ncbi:MAG TPA: HIT domain-containing protein [Thioalkalivibrio sp.]|nr:HIT domain-containing protein [Thioalkalivibrio sp.]
MAELHPQLAKDCIEIGRFPLCRVLLMNDANYPWFILVPDREDVREIFELSGDDQRQWLRESAELSRAMVELFQPDKLNLGALGNMVPQLHIHYIARYQDDPAWPKPVWGQAPAKAYDGITLGERREAMIGELGCGFVPNG